MKHALKTVALSAIFLLVVCINILSDYISFSFSTAIFADAAYWLNVAILNTGLIIVIMVCRSYAKDKELDSNEVYIETQKEIDNAYVEFNKRKLCTEFNAYVGEVNYKNKLEQYVIKLNRKLMKTKDEARIEKFREKIERAGDDVKYVRVRYRKVRVASIFSRTDVNVKDEYDIDEHEARAVSRLILNRVLGIIAFSLVFTSVLMSAREFNVVMLYSTALKLFQVATSVYVGFSSGYDYVVGEILPKSKLKLQIIQRFLESRANCGSADA